MEKFKLFSYGFVHFDSIEDKEKFYNDYKGRKFCCGDENNNILIQFLPVKRRVGIESSNEIRNKHVIWSFFFF